MYNHKPEDYDCPFCRLVRGLDTKASSQDDIVYRDDDATAFVASSWWPNNPGHVLVVPNAQLRECLRPAARTRRADSAGHAGDNLYLLGRRPSTPEERRPYAIKLRKALADLGRK